MQFRVYLHPEVCKIMAFLAATVGFRAIILHTCGGLESKYGLRDSMFEGEMVRGLGNQSLWLRGCFTVVFRLEAVHDRPT